MKHNIITIICFVWTACLALSAYAEDSDPCEEYQRRMTIYVSSLQHYVIYDLSKNGSIEAPYVDSVWITGKDTSIVLFTCHVQSCEPIDISFLVNGYYMLFVQIGECVSARMFIARSIPSNIEDSHSVTPAHRKILRDGQLFIIQGDNIYNAEGVRIK